MRFFTNSQIQQMKLRLYLSLLILVPPCYVHAQHPKAHAHNDYEHERPLFDALKNGFTSIEADIYLINGLLIVAHDYPEIVDKTKTLANLYLDPLLKISAENGGRIYKNYLEPVYLLIDIKSDATETWLKLKEELRAYEGLISTAKDEKAVKIIISGNRPINQMKQEINPPAFIDGRPADLGNGISKHLMPWISENYFKIIGSFNMEAPTQEQKERIKLLAEKTHAEGKLLRFWASPDKKEIWEALLACGVDFINTDDLGGLNMYLLEVSEKTSYEEN